MQSVIPAKKIDIPESSLDKSQAVKQFRSSLVDILYSDLYNKTPDDIKLIIDGSYKGTKTQNDGNDLMYLYRGVDFIKDRNNVALVLVEIGEDAKVNLYEIPAQNKKPAKYVVTIDNSTVCRALYVKDLVSNIQSWGFDVQEGKGYAACVESTTKSGFEAVLSSADRIDRMLSPVIAEGDYSKSVKLVGTDKKKMETFANVVKLSFSNAE